MTQMPDFPLSPKHLPPPPDPEDPGTPPPLNPPDHSNKDGTMTTRTFHPKVLDVDLLFTEHSIIPGLATPMNRAYAYNFMFDELLQPDGNNFRDSTTVIKSILYKLGAYIALCAKNTTDTTPIMEIVLKRFTLIANIDDKKSRPINVVNSRLLNKALTHHSLKRGKAAETMTLHIEWSATGIDPSRAPYNIYDWSIFSVSQFPRLENPPVPPYVPQNTPQTPGTPRGQTYGTPAHDPFVQVLDQQNRLFTQNQQMIAALAPTYATKGTITPFIYLNYPTVVKDRYTLNQTQFKYHTPNDLSAIVDTTSVPNTDRLYHPDPQNPTTGFVTRDGTYFVLVDLGPTSEKNFRYNVPKCTGTSSYEFYTWYITFTAHCSRFGKYCHPYPCFTTLCTHPRGFTLGRDVDCDLNPTFETKITNDSQIIWDLIYSVFKDHDSFRSIIELNNGRGYEALHSIVSLDHPFKIETPSTLVTNRPCQDDLSIPAYWNKYNHWIMLRALIESNT